EPFPSPALRHLWKGQASCAYWHGLFGGIYLSHLRHVVYQNLIAAEHLAEIMERGEGKYLNHEILDLDRDLWPEISITSQDLGVLLKPSYGGSLLQLDYRPKKFNLTNVMSRRPEAYHRKLKRPSTQSFSAMEKGEKPEDAPMYDWYNRYSFLDHFFGEETSFDQFRRCQYPELGNFINQPYEVIEVKNGRSGGTLEVYLQRSGGLWKREGKVQLDVGKRYRFQKERAGMEVGYEIINRSPSETKIWFGVELNLTLLAGNDPERHFIFPGLKMENQPMDSSGTLSGVENILLRDDSQGFEVALEVAPKGQFWRFPIETISQSERGYEKTYQGTALLFHWQFVLQPEEKKYLPIILSCGGISI
ncbi:MAG: 4-alpha-glucanotransferase, partial [Deltaproteobacteria bacterium]|nr:4-alpha-glucanotransferase [Deltaproteobacteria bacterium]